jgi:hypothetical protein
MSFATGRAARPSPRRGTSRLTISSTASSRAIERTINGVPRPIFYKGEQVGEWRHYDERLTMFLLRSRRPARYGKWVDQAEPPRQPDPQQHFRLADARS